MRRLLDAPHRLLFFAALVQSVLAGAWWAATLAARHAGRVLPALPGAEAHALLMVYGFMPLFIFGFLFTAGPRWLGAPQPTRAQYLPPSLLMALAAWLLGPALAAGAMLAGIVLLAYLAAWLWMLARFVALIRASRASDQRHARLAAAAVALGAAGLALAAAAQLAGAPRLAPWVEAAGVWGLLVPMFSIVCHRLIPLFTSRAVPSLAPEAPAWTLFALAGGSVAHGALAAAGTGPWMVLVDAPLGVLALALAVRWSAWAAFEQASLAMLHAGFWWLGIALALYAAQGVARLAGHDVLGLAPVHALGVGFLASLTVAMVSRVTLVHAGGAPVADRPIVAAFVALQAAALLRTAADAWPPAYSMLVEAAAVAWLACFAAFAWRVLPCYWGGHAGETPG